MLVTEGLGVILFSVIALWLLGITLVLFLQQKFLNRFTKDLKQKSLKGSLEKILKEIDGSKLKVKDLEKEIKNLQVEGLSHVQKVGLIRFNPFNEIGGDHSFVLAAMDGEEDGFVITCLHTRERTRMYAKEISKGKSGIGLSKEEERAISEARK